MIKHFVRFALVIMLISITGFERAAASDKSNLSLLLDLVLRRTLSHKVDPQAEFIGKGLSVPAATVDHSWLLSDWDSIAQELARVSDYPADDSRAEFVRSYQIPDSSELGYVWTWMTKGTQIYLVFHIQSDAGGDMTFVLNTHGITVDEAILVPYFNNIRISYRPFEVEKWDLDAPSHRYLPDALGHLGDEFFSRPEYFKPFSGQVISLPYLNLTYTANQLRVKSTYDWGNDGEFVEYPLPDQFSESLSESTIKKIVDAKNRLYADLKVRLNANGEITDVLAGVIYDAGEDWDESELVFLQPVPAGLLGAGALPVTE